MADPQLISKPTFHTHDDDSISLSDAQQTALAASANGSSETNDLDGDDELGLGKKQMEEVQLKYGASTVQGRREYQEDRYSIHQPLAPLKKPFDHGQSLFGVYDGHGGEWCAEYVSTHIHECIARQPTYFAQSKTKDVALQKGFLYCDERCLAEQETNGEKSGSTAVVVLIDHSDILVANCGDTRAILCRAGLAIELTRDHKPTDPEEKERMHAAGGHVPDGSGYVELGDKGLAVARAFGNPLFKQNPTKPANEQIIIPNPYQSRRTRMYGVDEFLILATDGLWNICSHQYACDFVRKRLLQNMDAEDIAHKLTQHALDRKSHDNVTIVIVTFPVAFNSGLLSQVAVQTPPTSSSTPAPASAASSPGGSLSVPSSKSGSSHAATL